VDGKEEMRRRRGGGGEEEEEEEEAGNTNLNMNPQGDTETLTVPTLASSFSEKPSCAEKVSRHDLDLATSSCSSYRFSRKTIHLFPFREST
jgi:hypothetical protein